MNIKKSSFSPLKRIAALLLTAALLFVFTVLCLRTANGGRYALKGENSVDIETFAEINGQRQFLRIRGEDASNPVMLFLHGGPGNPLTCVSYLFLDELYDSFTVCEWDQRGCGRTYYQNEGAPAPTHDDIISDIGAVIDYLEALLDKDKIVLMGYSWGSVAGIEYAAAHPEELIAYIGVGQGINISDGIDLEYEKYCKSVADPSRAMEEYAALNADDGEAAEHVMHAQRLMSMFGKELGEDKHGSAYYFFAAITGADTSLDDLRWKAVEGMAPNTYLPQISELAQYMYTEFDAREAAPALDCPALFISGEGDVTMPPELIEAYIEELDCSFIMSSVISDSGHSVMFDAPTTFCNRVEDFYEQATESSPQ